MARSRVIQRLDQCIWEINHKARVDHPEFIFHVLDRENTSLLKKTRFLAQAMMSPVSSLFASAEQVPLAGSTCWSPGNTD